MDTEVTSETGTEETPGPESTGDNPAWNDFLKDIPTSMHEMVKPHLSRWDQSVQERINSVHSEYADYKPYREAGIEKQLIDESLQIYDALNKNPQEVYRILAETYGFTNQPQQQGQNQTVSPEQEIAAEHDIGEGGQFNPEIARLQEMTNTMAQLLVQQETARQEAAADAELDSELKRAQEKYGAFDERFVLSYAQTGMSIDDAVKAFVSYKNELLSSHNRPQAPVTLSGSGQLPSNAINPAKLDGKSTRELVANMFRAQNSQG